MDSIPLSLSSLSPLQTHSDPQMRPPKTTFPLLNRFLAPKTTVLQIHLPISKTSSHLQNFHTTQKTIFSPFQSQISTPKTTVHLKNPHPSTHFSIPKTTFHLLGSMAAAPLPTYAETLQFSDKIDIEKTLIAIDDFFNRYPFFVASVTFIWLVVIPVTQELLKKYKSIATIDAFRKLRDDPSFILLDIRPAKSVLAIGSPNLKTLKKTCVNVEYREGEDEDFVKKVMEELSDPPNTTVCVLDNFDGNSMKVAKLLVENGFKEAYAIKGGIMGKDGWQMIQETLLPASVHVHPRKKKSKQSAALVEMREKRTKQRGDIENSPSHTNAYLEGNTKPENGHVIVTESPPQAKATTAISSSPYPNYPDLKPPSSPSPSKPTN